jgi:signal transduction histidine kinase
VPALVDLMRQAGISVELFVEGDRPSAVSTLVDWSAHRIVQEALTNVTKHAPQSHTEVTIRYLPEAVSISVVDDGVGAAPVRSSAPGSGRGLIGMRERVAVLGGLIDIGPDGRSGFAVRARLPIPAGS